MFLVEKLRVIDMLWSFDKCNLMLGVDVLIGAILWVNALMGVMLGVNVGMLGVNVLIGAMLGVNVEMGEC